jgi:hypothetical protein
VTRWFDAPDAQALLAKIVADPPAKREFIYRFNERETRYVGNDVRDLRKLYSAAGDVLMAAGDEAKARGETDPYAAFYEWMRDTPDAVIEQSLTDPACCVRVERKRRAA